MPPLSIIGFEGKTAPPDVLERIAAGRVAGVVLFARNLGSPVEVAQLVRELVAATPPGDPPLIVSVDQEGGRVQRLRAPLTVWPPMARLGAIDDEALTEAVGRALGAELSLFGFNVDYAPVCDVATNAANPVIGDRAFAATALGVARHATAFLRGLEAAGVRGCAKHFPGHGDTATDSHLALPLVERSMESVREVELLPFRAAIAAGVGMIMTAHIVLPALDARPATMSRAWLCDVLRGELQYAGVIVSDDLDMKAVADHFSVEEVVRDALAAGVDAFLLCRDPERQRADGAHVHRDVLARLAVALVGLALPDAITSVEWKSGRYSSGAPRPIGFAMVLPNEVRVVLERAGSLTTGITASMPLSGVWRAGTMVT